jgi:hypothetical protein
VGKATVWFNNIAVMKHTPNSTTTRSLLLWCLATMSLPSHSTHWHCPLQV